MEIARGVVQKRSKAAGSRAEADWVERAEKKPRPLRITEAERRLIDLVRIERELTKSDLVAQTDFSRTKITSCIDSLLEKQIIVANASTEYSGGRRSKSFRLNEKLGLVAGLQIGATSVDLGVADYSGRILVRHEESASVKDGPITSLGRACSLLENLLEQGGLTGQKLDAIGIGVPGPVDFSAGTVVSPPIMPGWDRYPIVDTVQQWFPSASVVVDNDVNVMALGELNAGAAKGVDNLIFVKIGTGIGAGIICAGRIYRGSNGCAGDIGHICVDQDGPVCQCGNKGCLEKIAAGPAIAERSLIAARAGQSPTLLEHYVKNGNLLRAEDVGAAAGEGDALAIEVIRQSGRHIGQVLAALVNFFNPDMMVIGGGVSNLGDLLLSSIRQVVFGRSLPLATRNLQIVLSGIPAESAAIGAVNLALNYVFTTESPSASGAEIRQRVQA